MSAWRAGILECAVAGCTAAAISFAQTPTSLPQSFRGNADAVTVDVTVRDGSSAVAGLAARDFVVADNGVPQRVEAVDSASLPVDLTLVVDVSGNTLGLPDSVRSAAGVVTDVTDKARRAAVLLRPADRIRLFAVDTYVTQVFPLQTGEATMTIGALEHDGRPSLHDALVAALLQPEDANRRHVVLAFTKGEDLLSAIDAESVREVARRSDAALHIIEDDVRLGAENAALACECAVIGLCTPTRKFWSPVAPPRMEQTECRSEADAFFSRVSSPGFWTEPSQPQLIDLPVPLPRPSQHPQVLADAATLTGGEYHETNMLANRDLAATFARVIDDFRQAYVLRYTPQSVKREGWHEVSVSTPGHSSFRITARRGYAIEGPVTAGLSRELAASSPNPHPDESARVTPDTLARAFERGDDAGLQAQMRRAPNVTAIARELRAAGSPWPSQPNRGAVFLLETLTDALAASSGSDRTEIAKVLQQVQGLVRRPLGADAFECAWYWTELARLEGLVQPALALPLADRALARCPAEPRLVLAQAFLTDQQWPLGNTTSWPGQPVITLPDATRIAEVFARYDAAIKFPTTAAEARVRAAWFACRIGDLDRAQSLLPAAGEIGADPQIRFLAELVRGHVLRDQARGAEAVDAFRAALAIAPGAQSARVSLMTLLLERGDRSGAEALAGAVQTAGDDQVDPWWFYWLGDFRGYPAIMARLQEVAR